MNYFKEKSPVTSDHRPLTPDDPASIAMIGCGGISNSHMGGIALHPELNVIAAADIDEQRLKEWTEKYDVPSRFTDWKEMVREKQPELVVFATWPAQHHEQIIEAAGLGVPAILCEKSFALTYAEGKAMVAACRESGTIAMEAFMYRHAPRTIAFIERVNNGEFGKVRTANASFSSLHYNPEGDNWRNRKETGGGIVYDFTCYTVNILRGIMGRAPERVVAAGETCPMRDIIITMHGLLDFGDGVACRIESSQKSNFRMEAEVVLEKGVVTLPHFLMTKDIETGALPRLEGTGGWFNSHTVTEVPVAFGDPYALQLLNLARQLREGEPSGMPLDETLDNLRTIDALVRSYESGGWESVEN